MKIYHKIINEETMKIGILGLNNVGKSYLLSKMVRVEIPTGYSIETKGISIKYTEVGKGEEQGICILDSAGNESPLLKKKELCQKNDYKEKEQLENNKSYDNIKDKLSKDKAMTELFIEKAIISLSDMIILVVGKLTRTEQKLITRIKETAKMSNNKIRSIIIIHNLAQYHKIIEVERYIENYLYRSATFNVEKKNVIGNQKYNGRYYFVEQFNKDDNIEIIDKK
jgi:hypothetical protein